MRITRGHYNRKLLAFGAMAFLAIALISTGFAAWIMSSGAETGFEDGNLTVGEITESDLKFTDYEIIAGDTKLLFEPAQGDVTGDIKGNGSDYENLTFTLKTTISPVEYLDEIQMSMTFPESVVAAHEAGYIVLPASALLNRGETLVIVEMNEGTPKAIDHDGVKVTATKEATGAYVEITIEVTIKWGTEFKGKNPSISLDEDITLTSEAKKEKIFNFKKTIYGLTQAEGQSQKEFENLVFGYNDPLQYSLKLIATVN